MEAAALNAFTSKSDQGSDSWIKYLVYGGIVLLTIAGAKTKVNFHTQVHIQNL